MQSVNPENLAWIVPDDDFNKAWGSPSNIGRFFPLAHPPSYSAVTCVCILPQYMGDVQNEWRERGIL